MGDGGAALDEEEEEEALEGMEEDALDEDGEALEDMGRWWCGRCCGRGWRRRWLRACYRPVRSTRPVVPRELIRRAGEVFPANASFKKTAIISLAVPLIAPPTAPSCRRSFGSSAGSAPPTSGAGAREVVVPLAPRGQEARA